ncbi:MAG: PQ-loop domain-containing transporter [Nitrososphaerota archaeon]
MSLNLPIVAGAISTIIFVFSELPMLIKAFRTKNLASYSLGNILLANTGNVTYSIYVFHLPPGPIWLMHTFYLTTTGLMLFWYLRYEWQSRRRKSLASPPRSHRSRHRGAVALEHRSEVA